MHPLMAMGLHAVLPAGMDRENRRVITFTSAEAITPIAMHIAY